MHPRVKACVAATGKQRETQGNNEAPGHPLLSAERRSALGKKTSPVGFTRYTAERRGARNLPLYETQRQRVSIAMTVRRFKCSHDRHY